MNFVKLLLWKWVCKFYYYSKPLISFWGCLRIFRMAKNSILWYRSKEDFWKSNTIIYWYTRKLWYQHLILFFLIQNSLCDFKTNTHETLFCSQNLVLKAWFKDFWYTNINQNLLWIKQSVFKVKDTLSHNLNL